MARAHHCPRIISCFVQYCLPQNATIVAVIETSHPNINFKQDLNGPRLVAWSDLLGRMDMVQLTEGSDIFNWNLNAKKILSRVLESMYRALC